MPATLTTFLLLWSGWLLTGAEPPVVAPSAAVRATTGPALAIAEATDSGLPWRISEADTEEEKSDDDGEHAGLAARGSSARRPRLDGGPPSAIRRDPGIVRPSGRSPILRC